jgi:outer membrane receptor protein involved in Fe transport
MKSLLQNTCILFLFSAVFSTSSFAEKNIQEVIVTSDFRDNVAQTTAASLTIVSDSQIQNRAAKHLQDVINLAPNVNSASGASRGRFFQIRGIGERSQFKEPLDSSVGLVVDGIDFSNLGLAGGLYDVEQVEILQGPQGTTFGSSAMGGVINLKSSAPTQEFEGRVDLGSGNYGSKTFGMVASGPLSEDLLGRVSINKNSSDGYIENDFLKRDNTSNLDELSARAKLNWTLSDTLHLDFTAVHIDADNGYDDFSLENTRNTRSDEPGRDRQESTALSVLATWDGFEGYTLETQVTAEVSNLEYSFDWDFSDWDTVGVRGFENNARDRQAKSFDMRILSKPGSEILNGASWVGGVYAYDRQVDLNFFEDADYPDDWGAWTSTLTSRFNSSRQAAYGQLDWDLASRWLLSLGARFEHFENDYVDSYGVIGDISDDLFGGKLSLQYESSDNLMFYGALSRGYKTSGLNTDAYGKALTGDNQNAVELLNQKLTYDSEAVVNYELGLKGSYLEDSLIFDLTAFYMDRQDMQAKLALEISTGKWTEYRDNIDSSDNYGIELEASWQSSEKLQVFAALGILEAKLGTLIAFDSNTKQPMDQTGRDQAHAPAYQYNLGMTYDFIETLSLTLQLDGKDSFYFSNSHNQQSDAYELLHANLSYQQGPLTLSLWGRNLLDRDYHVRGFYFANNPNNGWITEPYTQLGEPRVFGLSAKYDF